MSIFSRYRNYQNKQKDRFKSIFSRKNDYNQTANPVNSTIPSGSTRQSSFATSRAPQNNIRWRNNNTGGGSSWGPEKTSGVTPPTTMPSTIGPRIPEAPTGARGLSSALKARQRKEAQRLYDTGLPQAMGMYDTVGQGLKESETENLRRRQAAQDRLESSLGRLEQGAEAQISQAETGSKEDLRALAQSKRLTDAQRKNIFAQLGTVESGGYSGYTGQQANADTEFLRGQQQIMQNKESNINEIRLQLSQDRAEAESLVEEVVQEYDRYIMEIRQNMSLNDQQKVAYQQQLFSELQNTLNGIESDYTNREMEFEALLDKAGQKDEPSPEKQALNVEMKNTVDSLLNENLAPVSGFKQRVPAIPGLQPNRVRTEALFEKLMGQLQLSGAGLLKGSGSVSDAERKLIGAAMTGEYTNINRDDLREALLSLQIKLGGTDASSGDNFTIEEI